MIAKLISTLGLTLCLTSVALAQTDPTALPTPSPSLPPVAPSPAPITPPPTISPSPTIITDQVPFTFNLFANITGGKGLDDFGNMGQFFDLLKKSEDETVKACVTLLCDGGSSTMYVNAEGESTECNSYIMSYLFSSASTLMKGGGGGALGLLLSGQFSKGFGMFKVIFTNAKDAFFHCKEGFTPAAIGDHAVTQCYSPVNMLTADGIFSGSWSCTKCFVKEYMDDATSIAFGAFLILLLVGWIVNSVLRAFYRTIMFVKSVPTFFVNLFVSPKVEQVVDEQKEEEKKEGDGDVTSK